MTIGNRIDEAIVKLSSGDMENALIQIAIAIDATAKKKYDGEKKVGKRIKTFVMAHEDYITHYQMNGRLKIITGAGIGYGDKGSLGQVVYKSLRCALLHEADISDEVVFNHGPVMGMDNGKFIVTDNLLWGLVFILIGEETNSKQRLKAAHKVQFNGTQLDLDSLWGNEKEIKMVVGYVPAELLYQQATP